MNRVLIAGVLACSTILAGCASRPNAIAPTTVSALEYKDLSCEETKAMLAQKREEQEAYTQKQKNAATADAVGVFLFLVPVGSVFGADNEGKLAQAKGEVLALERAIPTNCKEEPDPMG